MEKRILLVSLLGILMLSCSAESDSLDSVKNNVNVESNVEIKSISKKPDYTTIGINNGLFVRNVDDGKIYIVMERRRRYIESPLTLNGLFKNPTIHNYSSSEIAWSLEGAPIKPDNNLIVENNTGRVFLREGNVIRYIPSMDIYNLYKFNNNAKVYVSSISNYTWGPNVGTTQYPLP